jgi:hypothetical protein
MAEDNLLDQGIAFLEAGDKNRAHRLFAQVVEKNPQNAIAWLWLSKVVVSTEERRNCLENALTIDPQILVQQQAEVQLSPSVMDMAQSLPHFEVPSQDSTQAEAIPHPAKVEPQVRPDFRFPTPTADGTSAAVPQKETEPERPHQGRLGHQTLQTIGEIYKALGVILAALTLVIAIGVFVLSTVSGTTIIGTVADSPNMFASIFDGLLVSLFILIFGGSLAVTLYAAGEGMYLLLTIEDNTYKIADLLQKFIEASSSGK